MTELEEAEAALKEYERSVASGHPWVPGGVFNKNPGLDNYILGAFKDFVRSQRVVEQARPAKRVSLNKE